MIYPEAYSTAFAKLHAQEFTIQRTPLDARTENNKKPPSKWETETAQFLVDMYSVDYVRYRHLVFDSAESVYAWNGHGFVPVDVLQGQLLFYDDWSEHVYPTSQDIRTADELLCWQLDQFARRLAPSKQLKSLWVIGTQDTLPIEEAIELATTREYQIKKDIGLVSVSMEDYKAIPRDDIRRHLMKYGEYECSNILQHAKIKVAQAI